MDVYGVKDGSSISSNSSSQEEEEESPCKNVGEEEEEQGSSTSRSNKRPSPSEPKEEKKETSQPPRKKIKEEEENGSAMLPLSAMPPLVSEEGEDQQKQDSSSSENKKRPAPAESKGKTGEQGQSSRKRIKRGASKSIPVDTNSCTEKPRTCQIPSVWLPSSTSQRPIASTQYLRTFYPAAPKRAPVGGGGVVGRLGPGNLYRDMQPPSGGFIQGSLNTLQAVHDPEEDLCNKIYTVLSSSKDQDSFDASFPILMEQLKQLVELNPYKLKEEGISHVFKQIISRYRTGEGQLIIDIIRTCFSSSKSNKPAFYSDHLLGFCICIVKNEQLVEKCTFQLLEIIRRISSSYYDNNQGAQKCFEKAYDLIQDLRVKLGIHDKPLEGKNQIIEEIKSHREIPFGHRLHLIEGVEEALPFSDLTLEEESTIRTLYEALFDAVDNLFAKGRGGAAQGLIEACRVLRNSYAHLGYSDADSTESVKEVERLFKTLYEQCRFHPEGEVVDIDAVLKNIQGFSNPIHRFRLCIAVVNDPFLLSQCVSKLLELVINEEPEELCKALENSGKPSGRYTWDKMLYSLCKNAPEKYGQEIIGLATGSPLACLTNPLYRFRLYMAIIDNPFLLPKCALDLLEKVKEEDPVVLQKALERQGKPSGRYEWDEVLYSLCKNAPKEYVQELISVAKGASTMSSSGDKKPYMLHRARRMCQGLLENPDVNLDEITIQQILGEKGGIATLETLPYEVVMYCLDFLGPKQVGHCEATSSHLRTNAVDLRKRELMGRIKENRNESSNNYSTKFAEAINLIKAQGELDEWFPLIMKHIEQDLKQRGEEILRCCKFRTLLKKVIFKYRGQDPRPIIEVIKACPTSEVEPAGGIHSFKYGMQVPTPWRSYALTLCSAIVKNELFAKEHSKELLEIFRKYCPMPAIYDESYTARQARVKEMEKGINARQDISNTEKRDQIMAMRNLLSPDLPGYSKERRDLPIDLSILYGELFKTADKLFREGYREEALDLVEVCRVLRNKYPQFYDLNTGTPRDSLSREHVNFHELKSTCALYGEERAEKSEDLLMCISCINNPSYRFQLYSTIIDHQRILCLPKLLELIGNEDSSKLRLALEREGRPGGEYKWGELLYRICKTAPHCTCSALHDKACVTARAQYTMELFKASLSTSSAYRRKRMYEGMLENPKLVTETTGLLLGIADIPNPLYRFELYSKIIQSDSLLSKCVPELLELVCNEDSSELQLALDKQEKSSEEYEWDELLYHICKKAPGEHLSKLSKAAQDSSSDYRRKRMCEGMLENLAIATVGSTSQGWIKEQAE